MHLDCYVLNVTGRDILCNLSLHLIPKQKSELALTQILLLFNFKLSMKTTSGKCKRQTSSISLGNCSVHALLNLSTTMPI